MSPNRSNHQENLYCEHFDTAAVIFPKESFSIHDCGSDETTLKIDLKAFFTLCHLFIFVENHQKSKLVTRHPPIKERVKTCQLSDLIVKFPKQVQSGKSLFAPFTNDVVLFSKKLSEIYCLGVKLTFLSPPCFILRAGKGSKQRHLVRVYLVFSTNSFSFQL